MSVLRKIIQSSSDKRIYKSATLKNKLQYLLVSDKDTDKSGACIDVNVGHLEDPIHVQGLAHFLEHMLFLGTKKYPNQNQYSEYLAKNSGQCNAYTNFMNTNYFFECSNDGFYGALDIFSQFFKEPLFTESCTERELNAVHSEHQKNLMSDMWREHQLFRHLSKKGNPFNKFGTGSKETLDIPSIRQELLDFYYRYYSANIMKLVIYGKEDIEQLEKYAIDLFSEISNKETIRPIYNEQPYQKEYLGKLIKVIPIKDQDKLSLSWIIDDMRPHYKSNPYKYISHLLGHEGKNSLYQYLLDEGLIEGMGASHYNLMNLFTVFNLDIDLTVNGTQQYENVIELVFRYLHILKEKKPEKWIFQETQKLSKLKFEFKDKEKPFWYTSTLANRMQEYPTHEILIAPYLNEEFNPELIQTQIHSLLNTNNLNITFYSKTHANSLQSLEPYYNIHYSCQPLPEKLISAAQQPFHYITHTQKILDLPVPNVFIPDNLDIKSNYQDNIQTNPTKIIDNHQGELWFKQDHTFQKPKALLYIDLLAKKVFHNNAESAIYSSIWNKLMQNHLKDFGYQASVADIKNILLTTPTKLHININGYNDSLKQFLEELSQQIMLFDPENYKSQHNDIVEQFLKKYRNFFKNAPYQQSYTLLNLLLQQNENFHPEEGIKVLEEFKQEKLREFHETWLNEFRYQILLMGNITEQEATDLLMNFYNKITTKPNQVFQPLPKELLPEQRIVNIPSNTTWIYQHQLQHQGQFNEKNSAIVDYYQYQEDPLDQNLLGKILQTYISEKAFDQLRTNEQLGYIVFCQNIDIRGVNGFSFIVQSSVKSPSFISERISLFLKQTQILLNTLTEEEFQQYIQSLKVILNQKDLSLTQEADRYWNEIYSRRYQFNKKEVQLEKLDKIKKNEFIQYFEHIFFTNKKRLEVHVVSEEHAEENQLIKNQRLANDTSIKMIPSYQWFQRRMPLYPDYFSYL